MNEVDTKESKEAEKTDAKRIEALNRLKSRKEACPELIAYLPPTIPDTLHNHILNFMEPLGIDTREWTSCLHDIIKFVRKVKGEWDEGAGMFRPCDEYRRDEEWIVHWMKADKFVDLAVFDETGMALRFHLERVRECVSGAKVLLVLEGLGSLLSRAKNARGRAHDAAVRTQLGESSRTKRDERLLEIDMEKVEETLIEMQLVHEIRLIQTSSSADSAEWISILAADIASIPYKFAAFPSCELIEDAHGGF